MNEQLKLLIDLQEMDLEVQKEKSIVERETGELDELKESLSVKEEALREERDSLSSKGKDLRTKERQLEDLNLRLKEERDKVYKVKSQKELGALDEEVREIKEQKASIEQDMLVLMEDMEGLSPRIKAKEEVAEKELGAARTKMEEAEKVMSRVQEKIDSLLKTRQEIAEKIEASILAEYEKLYKVRGGCAVVAMEDYACQGCNMAVSAQSINDVKKNEYIIRCESCARILYYPDTISS